MNTSPLQMMTEQEVYDKMKNHLLKQNSKSVRGPIGDDIYIINCAYRGVDNTSCAAGCLILDEHYQESMEGKSVVITMVREALLLSGVPQYTHSLVKDAQVIHDRCKVEDWPRELALIALRRGLRP